MKPEEQRIAIAEACGWSVIFFRGVFDPKERDYVGHHESCPRPEGKTGKWQGPIPDYLNDLNAMHSAEKVLQQDIALRNRYADELRCIDMPPTEFFYLHATAAQRAEAFLKTIGKWK